MKYTGSMQIIKPRKRYQHYNVLSSYHIVYLQLAIDIDCIHETTDGQVQMQRERLPHENRPGIHKMLLKKRYHRIKFPSYFWCLALISLVACVIADILDPINYILTDSEYYGIPVSQRAKCIILLAVACISTIVSINYGCCHHHYCYEDHSHRVLLYPVFTDLFPYLLLPWILSYVLNDCLITTHFIINLIIYILVVIIYTLIVYCQAYCTIRHYTNLKNDGFIL